MSSKERKEKILKKINKEKNVRSAETKGEGISKVGELMSGTSKTVKKVADKLKMESKPQTDGQDKPVKKAMYSNDKALKDDKIMDKIFKEKGAFKKSQSNEPSDNPFSKLLYNSEKAIRKAVNKFKGMSPDARYKMIGAWVVGLVFLIVVIGIVVSSIGDSKKQAGNQKDDNSKDQVVASADASGDGSGEVVETNPLTVCNNEAIANLVNSYIQALKTADIETLKALDMCQDTYNKDADIKNTSSVVEDYQNITIYTKNGPYVGGVTAYVVTDIKFINIEKTCQGMFQYIIRPQEDGSYKIDTTPTDDIDDDDVENAMVVLSQSEDVLSLIDAVNQQCAADIEADANLKAYVEGTLGNAGNTDSSMAAPEGTTAAPETPTEAPAADDAGQTPEQPAQ